MKNQTETKVILKFIFYILIFGFATVLLLSSERNSAVKFGQLTAIFGTVVSIYLSKIYFFLTPKKISGRIINLDVRIANPRKYPGAVGQTYTTVMVSEVVIDIETKDKKIISKVFPFKESNRTLKVGDQVAFVRFNNYPEKLD